MAERLDKIHAWVETGEVRPPKEGDVFLTEGYSIAMKAPHNFVSERPILTPVPGPLWRLGEGDGVISECSKEEATHWETNDSTIYCLAYAPKPIAVERLQDFKRYVRITPVAVPRDERRAAFDASVFEEIYEAALAAKGAEVSDELLKVREAQLRNAVILILRLSRCLPRDNKVRDQALDYLVREGLMPSPLRDAPPHLQLGSTEENHT